MNWTDILTAVLDAAKLIAELAANWSLQATILIVAALGMARFLARRGSAVQSVVYRTALASVVLCPAAGWVLAGAGFSGWSIELPQAWTLDEERVMAERAPAPSSLPAGDGSPEIRPAEPMEGARVVVDERPETGAGEFRPTGRPTANDVGPSPPAVDSKPAFEPTRPGALPTVAPRVVVGHWGYVAVAICCAWFLLAALGLIRLTRAWVRSGRLCRKAAPADEACVALCREVSARLGIAAPEVRRSPYLPSPCLMGLRRPVVLLTEAELSLCLRDVLVHELAHLARRDCQWNLLLRITLAVFSFHPFMWILSRRLEAAAEEVCDDYVVQFGGDRQEYAHSLVDIAELSLAPLGAAGVGIVSVRSMLGARVRRIMDTSRSLSTRVGNLLLAIVLATAVLATAVVGLFGIGPRASIAQVAAPGADEVQKPDKASAAPAAPDNNHLDSTGEDKPGRNLITVHGRVVDPDGRSVGAAAVEVTRSRWRDFHWKRADHELLGKSTTDQDGHFSLQVPYAGEEETPGNNRFKFVGWHAHDVVVSAPGYALAWVRGNNGPVERDIEVRLEKNVPLVQGRLVNLEGTGVPGARVAIKSVFQPRPDGVDKWLRDLADFRAAGPLAGRFQAIRAGDKQTVQKMFFPIGDRLLQGHDRLPRATTTDGDGRFEIGGLGSDWLLQLEISGAGIVSQMVSVVTRDMQPVEAQQIGDPGYRSHVYYGARFDLVVEPGQTIFGTVRDEETGAPLEGVGVVANRAPGYLWQDEGLDSATTDSQGRFQLEGLPLGEGNELKVTPSDALPYLMTDGIKVPASDGAQRVDVQVGLRRGIFVRGRVLEQETGKPADATLHYFPLASNEHARSYTRFNNNIKRFDFERDRYRTDADGKFQIVVVPGRGILGAQTVVEGFCLALGADQINGRDASGRFQTYDYFTPRMFNRVVEIDVPLGVSEVERDLMVSRGGQVDCELVDAEDKPLSGARVANAVPKHGHFARPLKTNHVEVVGLADDETRWLALWHEERKLGRVVGVKATDKALQLNLLPCPTLKGRLVDGDGEPIGSGELRADLLPSGDFTVRLHIGSVDSQGRFETQELLPGGSYVLFVNNERFGFKSLGEISSVEPGETIDLGKIDITAKERPEPKRTKATSSTALNNGTAGITGTFTRSGVTKNQAVPSTDKSNVNAESRFGFSGKVVDPSGQPAAEADIYLVFYVPQPTGELTPRWKPLTKTDDRGEFRFECRPADFGFGASGAEFRYASIAAVKQGFGFAWGEAARFEVTGRALERAKEMIKGSQGPALDELRRMLASVGQPLTLVADDEPIRGRIVDINGQAVAGARLTLMEVLAAIDDNLTAWHKAIEQPKADFYSTRMAVVRTINGSAVRSLVQVAITDAEGRFEIRGVGRGRIVELLLEGATIESAILRVRSERGETVSLSREHRSPELGKYVYYPAEFLFVAGPSAPIAGMVRDAKTKAPLAGVTIKSQKRQGEPINGWGQDFVRTVTDVDGNYRLTGMPIGKDNRIAAIAPDGDVPYLSMSKDAKTESPDRQLNVDFELHSGTWVEGRIVDKQTGKGLRGHLGYFVREASPSYQLARTLHVDERDRLLTDDDGHFRVAVLPGPGLLTFMADDHQRYPRASTILRTDGRREPAGSKLLQTRPYFLHPQDAHLLAEVNPTDGQQRIEMNLELDSGRWLTGRVVDPDGKPLSGFYYSGQMAQFDTWTQGSDDKFELLGYEPKKARPVYFAHRERNLAGATTIAGEPSEPPVVKLQPAGKVKGRLVDADGAALAGYQLWSWSPPMANPSSMAAQQQTRVPLPPNVAGWQIGQYETDGEGRFEFSYLVPGAAYRVRAIEPGSTGRPPRALGPLDVVIRVEPGETKDLGDVKLTDESKFTAAVIDEKSRQSSSAAALPGQIDGDVRLADGKPAAGALVAVIAQRPRPSRGGDFTPWGDVLAEGVVDDRGQFHLSLGNASSKSHRHACLIARMPGQAISWRPVDLDAKATQVSVTLAGEQAIRGRLVDIEGQPAAGVTMTVRSVMKRSSDGVMVNEGVGYDGNVTPQAWLPAVTSDAQGRFALQGVSSGDGAFLEVPGGEKFAPQEIALGTGLAEQRGERDGTYRPLVKNPAPGEEALLPLAPAQWFEGRVTYEDTGEPAVGARLTIWASQQQFGSMSSVAGSADEHGRYRINPHPGIRFGINAYPAKGSAYLARETSTSDAIEWRAGDRTRQVDVKLPRGALVRGTIAEAGTGTPVIGASIQYWPESANNKNDKTGILTGWQGIELSDEQGRFAIAVLPGPGRLLVHGPSGQYVLKETSERELNRGKPGGQRHYAHAIEKIDPEKGAEPLELRIELAKATTITGRLVDEQGRAIDEAIVISRLYIEPHSPFWRGYGDAVPPSQGGKFELSGLGSNEQCAVYFLDSKRGLGAAETLDANSNDRTVVLRPCGQATARYLDQEARPVKHFTPSLQIVVTPGAHRLDSASAALGKLAADADYASNVDPSQQQRWIETDDEGRVTFSNLIPGAAYRLDIYEKGRPKVLKEFTVKPGEKVDLGEFSIDLSR